MDRRNFIHSSCVICTSSSLLTMALEACTAVKYTSGQMTSNGLLINASDFMTKDGYRQYLVIRHDDLQFPICIYRIDENTYSALLMQCTHQGAELQVAGDNLVCPAHGSEFDKAGKVQQSPAISDLRNFPVSVSGDKIFIDLRKKHS